MKTPNDLRCELARRRLESSIKRSAGQHSRAVAVRFAAARMAIDHRYKAAMLAVCVGLSACGGGGGGGGGELISSAQAQTVTQTVHELRAIVRPNSAGIWFIQNDVDHAAVGIVAVTQTAEFLELHFDRNYTHAVTVQVTPDDDFSGYFTAGSNLGLSSMRIRLKANGVTINPANVYSYVPNNGGGNLWVNVTMVQR